MKKKRKYTFIKRIKNGKKATCQVGPYVIKTFSNHKLYSPY
jgi:hypothetical protein